MTDYKTYLYGTVIQVLPNLKQDGLITFDNQGNLRFTNEFFKQLQQKGYAKNSLFDQSNYCNSNETPVENTEGKKTHKVGKYTFEEPMSVQKLKMLYMEDFTNAKSQYKQALSLGNSIYNGFIKSLFGKDRPCDHIVDKKDSKMRVSAKSKKGAESFTMALIRPNVDYRILWIATAKAYSLEVGLTTCTLTTFFAEDRWESYYDEIEEIVTNDEEHEIHEMFGKRISNDGSETSDVG